MILQTAIFAAFGNGKEALSRTMNLLTGTVVCLNVLIAGVQGIYVSGKRKKEWKMEE